LWKLFVKMAVVFGVAQALSAAGLPIPNPFFRNASTPEPASWILGGAALVILSIIIWRKRLI
jgi:hypothetical protein